MSVKLVPTLLKKLNEKVNNITLVSQNEEFSDVQVYSNSKNQFIFVVYLEQRHHEQLDIQEIRRNFFELLTVNNITQDFNLVYDPTLDRTGTGDKNSSNRYYIELVFDRITFDSLGRKRLKGKVMDEGKDNAIKLTRPEKLLIEKLRHSEFYKVEVEEDGSVIIYDKSSVMNPILILE